MKTRPMNLTAWTLALCGALVLGSAAQATSLRPPMSLSELVTAAPVIVTGTVSDVTVAQEGTVPYTQVSVHVETAVRGALPGSTITFHQLNLSAARPAEDGRVYLGAIPGMPFYEKGEVVLLFLGPEGSQGFRTTVGLQQGKFSFAGGNVQNAVQNQGLFRDLATGSATLSTKEKSMIATTRGAVDADTFVTFLQRAVAENWWTTAPTAGNPVGSGSANDQNTAPRTKTMQPIGEE